MMVFLCLETTIPSYLDFEIPALAYCFRGFFEPLKRLSYTGPRRLTNEGDVLHDTLP